MTGGRRFSDRIWLVHDISAFRRLKDIELKNSVAGIAAQSLKVLELKLRDS